jgi:hypothetical protein
MPKKLDGRKANHESTSKLHRAAKQDQQEGNDGHKGRGKSGGYRQKIKEKKLAEGNKSKNGCSPKLLMLLLPFIGAGAYFLLRS